MKRQTTTRRALPGMLALGLLGGLLIPQIAHADGDKNKTVIVGPIVVTPDDPAPPPKKK